MSMSFKYDPLAYEMPWRPNYEKRALIAWLSAATTALVVQQATQMPAEPFYWMSGMAGVMALMRTPSAYRLHKLQKHLKGRELEIIHIDKVQSMIAGKHEQLWIGFGFLWENRHAQRVFEILKRDWATFTYSPGWTDKLIARFTKKSTELPMGQPWIHGVEPSEKKLYQPLKHAEGHSLIIGTTGAGKTRKFDLHIAQAIMRGECVIIVDPKGDQEMRDNARAVCAALGEEHRFVSFHPAFPEDSVRINPLANFTRSTEIASRISAMIPSEGAGDPFKSFGWQAINNIVQGLLICNEQPTIQKIRHHLESGPTKLLIKTIHAYATKHLPDWEGKAQEISPKPNEKQLSKLANWMTMVYNQLVYPVAPSSELEGLISMQQHDEQHFGKMLSNLLPLMKMLTTEPLGELLSPDTSNKDDTRLIVDSSKIIKLGMVAYIGLDSLTDAMVGSAMGSIILADLAAVAGARYNYGVDNKPVNIFVDEAAEVINDPTIQLLNKGRGARMRLFVATQTISDFTARLGNKDKAMQVLGNINNIYCLRVTDPETQKYVSENLPMTRLKYVMRTQGQNTQSDEPIMHGGNQGERLMEEEAELFPSQLLGMLPNLEYVAKISGGTVVKGRVPILER